MRAALRCALAFLLTLVTLSRSVTFAAVTTPPRITVLEPKVTDAELAPFAGTGTASISGRLIANLPGDRIRAFDHWRVIAIPLIPFTYWLEREVENDWETGNDTPADDNVSKLYKYARGTFTDENGEFTFKDLPPGEWFAYAVVGVKDGRSYTGTTESYEKTGTYLNGEGAPVGDMYEYVPHTYTGHYQCYTQGIVGDAFVVKANDAFKIPLALYGRKNDGC